MARVTHFEIHAADPARAAAFYTALFGWQVTKWGGPVDYHLITTGPDAAKGINGGLVKRMGPPPENGQPVNAYVCTLEVTDLDGHLTNAVPLGGTVTVPKMPIPGVGWLAYIKDPEGNILGMMQADTTAA